MTYAVGVDFGTTNSVIAFANEKGEVQTMSWPSAKGPTQTFRTALMFWKQGRGLGHVAGPQALERAIAAEPTERFIQSFKSHLASRVFSEARLFGQKVTIEDMVAIFLRHLFEAQGGTEVADGAFLAAGRPVVFAGERPDEELALSAAVDSPMPARGWRRPNSPMSRSAPPIGTRAICAATKPCWSRISAAAPAISPCCIFRMGRTGSKREALGHGGCGVAGDSFDFRLIDHVISPRLGKGATYRSLEKVLPLPAYFHASFAQWHQISWLKTQKTLTSCAVSPRSRPGAPNWRLWPN